VLDEHPLSMTGMLLIFVGVIAAVDLLTRRIPNTLTLSGVLVATAMHIWASGASGALQGLAGLLAGLGAFLPFYLAGGFGAGDVKAMGVVGSFLGVKGALLAAAWILISGAIAGLALLMLHGALPSLRARARKWALQVHATWVTGRVQLWEPDAADFASQRFPYGLAIACGTLVSVLWNQP